MFRKDLIIAVLLTFCLSFTVFQILPISSQEAGDYDPWYDINDDGKIDMKDVGGIARKFGTSGTAMNKTETLLDLLDRVEALENRSLLEGYMRPPAYDSGWVYFEDTPMSLILTHNLNTTELFVYLTFHDTIHTGNYGINGRIGNYDCYGVWWEWLNQTTITVYRGGCTTYIDRVRVMIWRIAEP